MEIFQIILIKLGAFLLGWCIGSFLWYSFPKVRNFFLKRKVFKSESIDELQDIWINRLMNNGWDVVKLMDLKWNFRKRTYEYYFIVKRTK